MAVKMETLLIIGIAVILASQMGWINLGTQSTLGTGTTGTSGEQKIVVEGGCTVDSTTATFSSWDAYKKGTDASNGHRALIWDGESNVVVADDGTDTISPGQPYRVLCGNLTSNLIGTTTESFYPVLLEGTAPCKGSVGLSCGQYQHAPSLTFTYWNSNSEANTAQALVANDEETVDIKFKAPNDECWGNPDAGDKYGVKNILCLMYNNTVYDSVELYSKSGVKEPTAPKPKSATAVTGKDINCYEFPIICDLESYEGQVFIDVANTDPVGTYGSNISISLHDVTYDYDADTLELIIGVEDEDQNDIGATDNNTGSGFIYSIATS